MHTGVVILLGLVGLIVVWRIIKANNFNKRMHAKAQYTCKPDLKIMMMAKYPDLKPAELEALNWLTTENIEVASRAIIEFMGTKGTFEVFVRRLKEFDAEAASQLFQWSIVVPLQNTFHNVKGG